jgi:hypothetical protein
VLRVEQGRVDAGAACGADGVVGAT